VRWHISIRTVCCDENIRETEHFEAEIEGDGLCFQEKHDEKCIGNVDWTLTKGKYLTRCVSRLLASRLVHRRRQHADKLEGWKVQVTTVLTVSIHPTAHPIAWLSRSII
jgi:hypothetical protein